MNLIKRLTETIPAPNTKIRFFPLEDPSVLWRDRLFDSLNSLIYS